MTKIALGTFLGLAVGVAMATLVLPGQPGAVDAQSHTATRTFQADWASPGSEVTVTLSTHDYGPFGQVEETLPMGFSYVRSSLGTQEVAVEGQTVRFTLFGTSAFTYVVKVPTVVGQYTFSGAIRNSDRVAQTIAGNAQLRVGPAPTPTPSPTPTATPTPTPSPTPSPTPTPTITPSPTPSPTATPVPTATPDIEATVDARVASALATVVASTPTAEEAMPTATPPPQPEGSDAFTSWVPALLIGIVAVAFAAGLIGFGRRGPR